MPGLPPLRPALVLLLLAALLSTAVDARCAFQAPQDSCCASHGQAQAPDECQPDPSTLAAVFVPLPPAAVPGILVPAAAAPPARLADTAPASGGPPFPDWVAQAAGLRAPPR